VAPIKRYNIIGIAGTYYYYYYTNGPPSTRRHITTICVIIIITKPTATADRVRPIYVYIINVHNVIIYYIIIINVSHILLLLRSCARV